MVMMMMDYGHFELEWMSDVEVVLLPVRVEVESEEERKRVVEVTEETAQQGILVEIVLLFAM